MTIRTITHILHQNIDTSAASQLRHRIVKGVEIGEIREKEGA